MVVMFTLKQYLYNSYALIAFQPLYLLTFIPFIVSLHSLDAFLSYKKPYLHFSVESEKYACVAFHILDRNLS